MTQSLNRYQNIAAAVKYFCGDFAADPVLDAEAYHHAIQAALARYSSFNERIEVQCIQLITAGLFGQSLYNWTGDRICEVAYLHWPASSTVAATTNENKITNWWYYNHGEYVSSTLKETVYVDLQVEGSTLPAASDYILVAGVCQHRIEGSDYKNYDDSDSSTYTTIPKSHDYLIALGAAAYALRMREVGPQLLLEGYISAYNMGVMAEMGERFMRDFEGELYQLSLKKLNRPPWGAPERQRLQREFTSR